MGKIRLKFGLSKNREKNVLIIYAPLKGRCPLNIVSQNNKKYSFFERKSEGKRGVGGGCGNVVNP